MKIEIWERLEKGKYNCIVKGGDRLPVGQVVRKLTFIVERKKGGGYVWRGRPVTLSLSPSLFLQRKNRERRERAKTSQRNTNIHINKQIHTLSSIEFNCLCYGLCVNFFSSFLSNFGFSNLPECRHGPVWNFNVLKFIVY